VATLHAAISLIPTDKAHLMPMFIPHRGVCNDSEIAESAVFFFFKANGLQRRFVRSAAHSKGYYGYTVVINLLNTELNPICQ